MSTRTNHLVSIIALLDRTLDKDYPALREAIIVHGELVDLPVPHNPLELGLRLAGYDPLTIEREPLRASLVTTLQVAYANAWLAAPVP